MTHLHGTAPSHTDHSHPCACDTGKPSRSSLLIGAETEAQAGPADFQGTLGEVEAGVGLQSQPSVYSPPPPRQELHEEKPLPSLSGKDPQGCQASQVQPRAEPEAALSSQRTFQLSRKSMVPRPATW